MLAGPPQPHDQPKIRKAGQAYEILGASERTTQVTVDLVGKAASGDSP